MADSKITALTAISTVDPTADPLVIVDVSDTSMAASGTTKKSTINQLLGSGGTATLASATITGALGAAGLNVTGATIPANGVYLGSANNLSFSAASTLGMTLNATGLGIGIAPESAKSTRLSVYQTGDLIDETAPLSVGNTAAGGMRLYAGVNNTNEYVYIGSVKSGTGYRSMILQPNGGNVGIGVVAASGKKLDVKSDGTANTTFAAQFRDSADAVLFSVRSDGYFNTGTSSLSPYNLITASAANMFVDSSGFVYRSTSSLKYKTDVKDSIHGLADVLKLRSVTYKSKNGDDTVFGGLIAEEVHAAGLTEFVAYAPDKTPDAIHYGNMVSLLIAAIKELTARVQTLEAK